MQAQQDQDTDASSTGRTLMAAAAAATTVTKPEVAAQVETNGHESQGGDGGAGREVEGQKCEDGT